MGLVDDDPVRTPGAAALSSQGSMEPVEVGRAVFFLHAEETDNAVPDWLFEHLQDFLDLWSAVCRSQHDGTMNLLIVSSSVNCSRKLVANLLLPPPGPPVTSTLSP